MSGAHQIETLADRRPLPHLVELARWFDNLPCSPFSIGAAVRARYSRRAPVGELAEMTWINAQGDVLEIEGWRYDELEASPAEEVGPWWLPAADKLEGARLTRVAWGATSMWQRAQRGWADQDCWSLRGVAARTLGHQLMALADEAHSWPAGEEFPTFADWLRALRAAGEALLTYAASDGRDTLSDAKSAMHWVADHLEDLWD